MAIARRSRIGWLLGSVAVVFVGGLVAVVAWHCVPPDSGGAGNHDNRVRKQEVQFTSGGNTVADVLGALSDNVLRFIVDSATKIPSAPASPPKATEPAE
jgi:hypothetical protein